jgi:glycosyltransferase involved in cell wall biosynthesis
VTKGGARRVLLVPDSIYWVTGTIAKAIARANPWMESTIVSGPLVGELFGTAEEIAERFDLVHFICPYASRDWLPQLHHRLPVVTSHHHVTDWKVISHNIDGDAIIAGSGQWVRDLRDRGADMTRVFRVPYGVDVDLFAPGGESEAERTRTGLGLTSAGPVIGFFAKRGSNDDDRKGTDVFADAVKRLRKTLPGVAVLMVGPGWQDLVREFRDAGIGCAWIPFLEKFAELPRLYRALNFYWVTARVEGGPVPLLEAMSCGVCCLSTPVGLAEEVVRDDVNGFLLPMNDAEAFARKTAELWADPVRRERIGTAARQTMRSEMREDEMARLVKPVYERAADVFAERNPGVARRSRRVRESSHPFTGDIPRAALDPQEQRRARMLESLAWSENLVLYQNQHLAALRMILGAWKNNPSSLEPPRVLLRRFLPETLVRRIVGAKKKISPVSRSAHQGII